MVAYLDLKQSIHDRLLRQLDLVQLQKLTQDQIRYELSHHTERVLQEESIAVNAFERRNLIRDIHNEMVGLGPLEPLFMDPTVSDILVNTHRQVYVERNGRLELSDIVFNDEAHLMKIIEKMISRVGRRIDESSPMVDARLPDGSRVNAIIPPLAIDGAMVSIRKFAREGLRMQHLTELEALSSEMATVMKTFGKLDANILVSGGTGSGKTTLLNILSASIDPRERIVTIEDAAELQLQQPHVVRLETRPANIEGKGEITQRALIRNALRMRPDRIILGEVRGAEALDMLQAMNTGHQGSMATIHANSPRDALARLENMICLNSVAMSPVAIRRQIASAIQLVIQLSRLADGQRKVMSMTEVTGIEGETISLQELFSYRQTGVSSLGRVEGAFVCSGIRPRFAEKLKVQGIQLDPALFHRTANS